MKPRREARGTGNRSQPTPTPPAATVPPYGPLPEAQGLFTEGKTAEVKDDSVPSWGSQAAQYPRTGPPGISYFRGRVTDDYFVDCLLYRDENGELVGILNHYPEDFPPYERKGNQNIWVRPDRRRQGIGIQLGLESLRRWEPLTPEDLHYTRAGLEWVTAVGTKGVGRRYIDTELDYREEGWEAWRDRVTKEAEEGEARTPEEPG